MGAMGPTGPEGPAGRDGATGPTGSAGATGPVGANGLAAVAQFVVQPLTYADGDYLSYDLYLSGGTGIGLGEEPSTVVVSRAGLYSISFIVQGRVAPGGYLQIVPVTGRQALTECTVTSHSSNAAVPLGASGTYCEVSPGAAQIRLRYRGSASTALTGILAVSFLRGLGG